MLILTDKVHGPKLTARILKLEAGICMLLICSWSMEMRTLGNGRVSWKAEMASFLV